MTSREWWAQYEGTELADQLRRIVAGNVDGVIQIRAEGLLRAASELERLEAWAKELQEIHADLHLQACRTIEAQSRELLQQLDVDESRAPEIVEHARESIEKREIDWGLEDELSRRGTGVSTKRTKARLVEAHENARTLMDGLRRLADELDQRSEETVATRQSPGVPERYVDHAEKQRAERQRNRQGRIRDANWTRFDLANASTHPPVNVVVLITNETTKRVDVAARHDGWWSWGSPYVAGRLEDDLAMFHGLWWCHAPTLPSSCLSESVVTTTSHPEP
jgi:hypothetical protein